MRPPRRSFVLTQESIMQLSRISLALASLLVTTAASAAPAGSRIAITAGASASYNNMATALVAMCGTAGGTATTLGSGNFRSIVCANSTVTEGAAGTYVSKADSAFVNFAGTNFAEVRINTEGSFSAVVILNPALNTAPQVRNPAAAANSNVYPAGSVIVGGLLDLEPSGFPEATVGANTLYPATAVGVAQVFGVAVSDLLYNKLFTAQKAADLLPSSCAVTDIAMSYCVPSVSQAQMASIMVDNEFNAAYSKGVGFLTGVPADDGLELRYARRVDNSGTQAVAQNYFLGLPCSKNVLGVIAEPSTDDEVVASGTNLKDSLKGAIRVMAAPGTGDVRNELIKADKYVIGVVSGENVQSQTWKWVRVNGAAMGEDASPTGNQNRDNAMAGLYNFVYESVYMGGSAEGDAFWATVATELNTLPSLPGLINSAQLAASYTKGGLACQAWVSN
jgi:hypothetical protein